MFWSLSDIASRVPVSDRNTAHPSMPHSRKIHKVLHNSVVARRLICRLSAPRVNNSRFSGRDGGVED